MVVTAFFVIAYPRVTLRNVCITRFSRLPLRYTQSGRFSGLTQRAGGERTKRAHTRVAMVSTRARKGSGSQAALAFKSTKRARGGGGAVKLAAASKRKKTTNATKARPLIEWPAEAKLVREEAEGPDPAADVDDDGPEPSEDTVVVEYDDLIQGQDEDAESPETEEGDDYESLR